MILEIESHHGDTLLFGKSRAFATLQQQLAEIENLYDAESDNFVLLLCRTYGWSVISKTEADFVGYIYDRDTQNLLTIHI